jgi:hypothetical protein
MTPGELGFLASALVLAAFGMKNMANLRIVAICSNFAFIAYAAAAPSNANISAPRNSAAAERLAPGTSFASTGLQHGRHDTPEVAQCDQSNRRRAS